MVSQSGAIAVAQGLIERNPEMEFGCIDLKDSFWTQSLFRRMGFKKGPQLLLKLQYRKPSEKKLN